MPTDPDESVPDDPLPEVPMTELIDRLRGLSIQKELDARRGEVVAAMRSRKLSWRQIEAQTGIPQANARRWEQTYLASQ